MDDDIIDEAISMRDRIGMDYALVWLQYKGIRTGKHRTVTAFAYIMHEERPIGVPSNFYMRTCLQGYDTFYFDKNILIDAYDKCREVCGYEG